ncbi:RNase H domain-containing protein [Trichonephila clavipes]|nr:RNase H domain-containing protein [Trichonephila clavipes]
MNIVVSDTAVGKRVWNGSAALVALMYFGGKDCLTPEGTVEGGRKVPCFLGSAKKKQKTRNCFGSGGNGIPSSLSEYSQQIVLQWIPGHCCATDNEFADHLAKKEASLQQITRKAVPFTSAKCIFKKKLNDLSSRQYAERNSDKIWWNNLKDLPMWPRRKAVAKFRLTTGHDCLLKHLHRIHVAQASFCTLCDFREGMDADHILRCPALRASSSCVLYWQAREV